MEDRLPFELTIPGTWIDLPDRQAAFEVLSQVILLQSAFAELSLALYLFEQDLAATNEDVSVDRWHAESSRRAQLMWECLREAGVDDLGRLNVDEAMVIGGRRAWLEDLARGILPRELRFSSAFLHAKAFLHAADSIGKIMTKLGERTDLPKHVGGTASSYYGSLRSLVGVRDSIQHMEDRGRGRSKGGKRLKLKPVQAGPISAPQGALILNHLNGRSFGTTMSDGSYGEVPVSRESLTEIRDHLEALLAALPWKGSRQHFPS